MSEEEILNYTRKHIRKKVEKVIDDFDLGDFSELIRQAVIDEINYMVYESDKFQDRFLDNLKFESEIKVSVKK